MVVGWKGCWCADVGCRSASKCCVLLYGLQNENIDHNLVLETILRTLKKLHAHHVAALKVRTTRDQTASGRTTVC